MDLAIVTGRGPGVLADIDGLRPLARDEDTVVFGCRDEYQAEREGSPDVRQTEMHVFSLEDVHRLGVRSATTDALTRLLNNPVSGFWIPSTLMSGRRSDAR
jgi:arginase